MVTLDRIVAKLWNDGFRYGMDSAKALEILGHCVAPVACQKFYREHESDIFDMLIIWENAAKVELKKISHDQNGNPRYVVHFLEFIKNANEYNKIRKSYPSNSDLLHGQFYLALGMARSIGGKMYRGKDMPGGIVFQSYNVHELRQDVARLRFYSKLG